MAKEKRGNVELVEIVKRHLGIEGLSVTVLPDNMYGRNAFAMNALENEPDIHAKMQWAVEQLWQQYELSTV